LKDIEFVGFDLKMDNEYLSTDSAQYEIINMLHLPHVEVLYEGKWDQEIQDEYTFGHFIPGTRVPHEGLVIKHITGDRKKVAKVINPDYLIYGEKHDVGDSH
jgi:hypothetical protein